MAGCPIWLFRRSIAIIDNIEATKICARDNLDLQEKIKSTILLATVILLLLTMALHPSYYILGAKTGVRFCGDILIPSLFPFIFLTSFIVKSGVAERFSKAMSPITKFLFYLPGSTGPTIIMGLIGGFPVGAKGIKNLHEKKLINIEQAERMLYFLVGAGPAFTISVVGIGLLKNQVAGVIIFLSQVLSITITGAFLGILSRFKKNHFYDFKSDTKKERKNIFINSIISSSYDSVVSMIDMCAIIVIFCCLISIIEYIPIFNEQFLFFSKFKISNDVLKSIVAATLEVTSGCTKAANFKLPLEFISFAIGWAGLCIQFQIFSISEGIKISPIKFSFFRFIQGAISGTITNIILKNYEVLDKTSFNFTFPSNLQISSSLLGSISLLITCICFLTTIYNET